MNKDSARTLVEKTLHNSFDKERFCRFARELLNHYEEKPFVYKGKYIREAYAPYIQSLERIGSYQDSDGKKIDILIAKLKKGSSLERARTMQRNFIAWYLTSRDRKDAALVAFVSPDPEEWRFSLVKMEYKIGETPTGRIKAIEEYTPARRLSFLVGTHETSHTAQSRLVPIIENDEHDPTLAEIEDAFNIEKATKEFFEKYRYLFHQVKEALDKIVKKDKTIRTDFEAKNIDTVDFSKKTLGQIVFLYFLQKKGWFGVKRGKEWGYGSKHFLRELFEKKHGDYDNFFNDILEPLFYEALRLDRPGDYYSRFDCRIPFLNGGLFDPLNDYDWVETDILLPNELFSNSILTKEKDKGTGILDILDRYNFTVKEDEPLEKEVAVDPEMLGKVFENLLEVKDRKSKGTYYTPREIVHYMCQESLINYLATELEGKAVKEDIETLVKFSESFVEHDSRVIEKGHETQTYSFKLPESIRDNAKLIDKKLASIRVCDPAVGSGAFPVGMMNEIIRSRNSLTPYMGKNGERTPYHFKRHAIQECLYGVDIDSSAVEIAKLRLWLSLVVDEEDRKTIQPLPNLDYKIVCGNSLLGVEKNLFNVELFQQLEELKPQYFDETNPGKKKNYKDKIDGLIAQITNGHKDFDFEVYFSEVFHEKKGFDVVIANPPWGSDFTKDEKKVLKEKYTNIDSSTPNSFAYFIGLAFEISKGNLAYILPDSILMKDYAKTRKLLKHQVSNINWYQNVGLPENLKPFMMVDHDVCVIITREEPTDRVQCSTTFYDAKNQKFTVRNWDVKKDKIIREEFDFIFNLVATQDDLVILNKIMQFKPLKSYLQCHEGIHTGNAREILFKKMKGNKSCKPLFHGGKAGDMIDNYYSQRAGWFVDYRKEIIDKEKGFYASLRDENIFIHPKIYITRTGNPFKAFLDENNYASNNFFSLQLSDYSKNSHDELKVFLPFVISKIAQFFIRTFAAPRLGNIFVETKIFHLLKFRVPNLSNHKKDEIRQIVDQIILVKKDKDYSKNKAKHNKVREYEKQIDQMVYKLYGLTPEEIKIVEGSQ